MGVTARIEGAVVPLPVPAAGGLVYRPDIDGLRAVAVLAVVVYHAFPATLPGGFVGVDLFFVISGFLISSIVFGALEAGTFSFAGFYARRVRRIFPALMAVLVAVLAGGWFLMQADEFALLGKHVGAGMGFVSNLVLWSEAGYFDPAAHSKPLLHLWSLGIEEQFYIAWPLLTWVAWRFRSGALVLVATVLAGSFAANLAGIGDDAVATFYSPLTRAWELAAGGLLAWTVLRGRLPAHGFRPPVAQGLSTAGLAAIAASLVVIDSTRPFPGAWAALPVLGAVALIAAGPQAWFNRHVLARPAVVWVGLISYPLYLWHWPLLFVVREPDGTLPSPPLRLAAIAAAVALSALTFHGLERHVRHRRGRRPMIVLIATALLVAAAGAGVWFANGLPGRAVARESGMTPRVLAQFAGPAWAYMSNAACRDRYPYPEAEKTGWWFCMATSAEPPTLAILGDSFANQIYPGLAAQPRLRHHTILSIGNCDVAKRLSPDPGRDRLCYSPTAGEGEDYLARVIRQTPSLRFVVLAGFRHIYDEAYLANLRRRISMLQRRGIQVIIFEPHLRIPFDPRRCFETRSSAGECGFPASLFEENERRFAPLRQAIARSHPQVRFFSQNGIFCEGERCSFVRDGLPMHRDPAGHLSEYASGLLGEQFTRWAERNVPGLLAPAPVEQARR